jgi:hypothetical protein
VNTVPLIADRQSDEVLTDAALGMDGQGHRVLKLGGALNEKSPDLFWFVDPRSGSYRTFRLTYTEADMRRIQQFIREKVPGIPQAALDRVRAHLLDGQRKKQAQKAAFERRAHAFRQRAGLDKPMLALASAKPDEAMQYPVCYGGGQAAIGTFDPVFIQLTETSTWSDWWYNGYGDFSVIAGGSCWAVPESIFGTHWYVAACYGELNAGVSHSFAGTENISYNYDFLFDDQYTWVDDQADVFHTNGFASWATFHVDYGEASELIFGRTLVGYAHCGFF